MAKTQESDNLKQTKLILHAIVSVLAILALGGLTFFHFTSGNNWAWATGMATVVAFWDLMDELKK